MESASGLIYLRGEFVEGSVHFARGRPKASQSPDPGADVKGIILPKAVDCHTHLGDAFIKPPAGMSVEELVAPPNGLKHRLLGTVSESVQVDAMRRAAQVMAETGTSHFIDFREGGLEGARRLLAASLGSGVTPVILGRPDSSDGMELSALLSVADGLGMSSISDIGRDEIEALSHQARSSGKAFAIHASEAVREDIGRVLDLKPDLLVHMAMATDEDLAACASDGVPVAICPTSNSYFGIRPPVRRMLDAGLTVCLGTDNAMLARPDMLAEVAALRAICPRGELADPEAVNIAFGNGGKVLNSLPGFRDGTGAPPDFFVLEVPADNPAKRVLEARAGDVRLFASGEIG